MFPLHCLLSQIPYRKSSHSLISSAIINLRKNITKISAKNQIRSDNKKHLFPKRHLHRNINVQKHRGERGELSYESSNLLIKANCKFKDYHWWLWVVLGKARNHRLGKTKWKSRGERTVKESRGREPWNLTGNRFWAGNGLDYIFYIAHSKYHF